MRLPRWTWFGRFLKWVVSGVLRYRVVNRVPLPDKPRVYVVHHQNLFGPVYATAHLPESHVWAFWKLCSRKDCFDQYYHYTFTERFGWPKPLAAVVAFFASLGVAILFRSIGAIPVYRGNIHLRQTMRMSVELLSQGHSIVLCPDVDYTSESDLTGELYTGFAGLASMTRSHSGVEIAFVPVHCHKADRTVYTGEPIYCAQGREGRRTCAEQLAQALNDLATAIDAESKGE